MPIPSLYPSGDGAHAWSMMRAAACGAALGAFAALFKTLGPLHTAGFVPASAIERLTANLLEIAGAALGFALLCAGAAALRNFVARRLVW